MKKQKSGLGKPLTGHGQLVSIQHALLSCMYRVLLQCIKGFVEGLLRKTLSHPGPSSAWRVCPAYVTHSYLLVPYDARSMASQVTIHGMPESGSPTTRVADGMAFLDGNLPLFLSFA
jgi:hypothetical protein